MISNPAPISNGRLWRAYRAWVTDLRSTVALRFEKETFVLSPADPEGMARALTVR
ncbi:MAG: hypothetical protein IT578_03610 [Verrucomicrobiae bacterium]|nr:hypothetical protein [Verrucomicrobiae bacterium]